MHYYVYYNKEEHCIYERTCGTKEAAQSRVKELEKRGYISFFTINHTVLRTLY